MNELMNEAMTTLYAFTNLRFCCEDGQIVQMKFDQKICEHSQQYFFVYDSTESQSQRLQALHYGHEGFTWHFQEGLRQDN